MTNILTFGGGVNSVALAIEMVTRSMPMDFIVFSDTLGEKPETYAYIEYFSAWLEEKNYPPVTKLPPYKEGGLYGECIDAKRLPSIVYGFKSCSEKWKLRPFVRFCRENNLFPANVYKGIDAGESHRVKDYSDKNQTVIFPLVDWGIDRTDCIKTIIDAGLKLPAKSSCFFCPSMRRSEVQELKKENPELLQLAIEMEENAHDKHTTIKGLARNRSWADIVAQQVLDFNTPIDSCDRCHD